MPSKFFTTLEDHQRNKSLYNMRHAWPDRHLAVADPQWLQQYIEQNGPYLYHGTSAHAAQKIPQDGLYPHDFDPRNEWAGSDTDSRSTWGDDFLRPRAGHVYLGTGQRAASHVTGPDGQLLQIDLRKLNPQNLTADEDAFGHYFNQNHPVHPVVNQAWTREPLPDEWSLDGDSLGAWADRVGLGEHNPEETHYSLDNLGSIAHRGPIPSEAISSGSKGAWGAASWGGPEGWGYEPTLEDTFSGPQRQTDPVAKPKDMMKMWGHVTPYQEYLESPPTESVSLQAIASKLDGLEPQEAVVAAGQMLREAGYTPNQLNLQAVVQTWQSLQDHQADLGKLTAATMSPGQNCPHCESPLSPHTHGNTVCPGCGAWWPGEPPPTDAPSKLYHHTWSDRRDQIEREGLDPTRAQGHGEEGVPGSVYLTEERRPTEQTIPPDRVRRLASAPEDPLGGWEKAEENLQGRTGDYANRSVTAKGKHLYHWTEARDLENWMDPSHTGPGSTYLTESGDAPQDNWNADVPMFDKPVRVTIDPSHLDPNLFDDVYKGWLGNHLYHGPIPPKAVVDVKAFKPRDDWDQDMSTEPSPDDHWPEFGEVPPDQHRDIQFSNDYVSSFQPSRPVAYSTPQGWTGLKSGEHVA